MASWQAHLVVRFLKWRVKPKLAKQRGVPFGALDAAGLRRTFTPPLVLVPKGVRISQGKAGGVPGEWVESSIRPGDFTLLYLHGGGYVACSPETHRAVTAAYAQQGFRVFAADYRLAPEHCFPAAVEDALAVFRGLRAADSTRPIVVSGESAGGGLALAMLVALRDAGDPLPAAAALFSPWTDLACTGASVQTNAHNCAMFDDSSGDRVAPAYLGGADPRQPLASPLYADLSGLPPLLIHVGGNEVLLDDSTRLAKRAKEAGVKCELKIWPVVPHAWQVIGMWIPEARQSVREAADWLRALASRGRCD